MFGTFPALPYVAAILLRPPGVVRLCSWRPLWRSLARCGSPGMHLCRSPWDVHEPEQQFDVDAIPEYVKRRRDGDQRSVEEHQG